MLEAMRQLALDYLFEELADGEAPQDLTAWFKEFRAEHPEQLFPFLVEDSGKVKELYTLEPDSKNNQAMALTLREVTDDLMQWLPFMRPSGSQGAQVGPILKRSFSKQKGGGPSTKIMQTTLASFAQIAGAGERWSPYFAEIIELISRPLLRLPDQRLINWQENYPSMLDASIDLIGEKAGTVFLAVADGQKRLPGERHEYLDYLMEEKLGGDRYVTASAESQPHANCSLCGATNTTVYPNGVKGAGINFGNVDREGAFSALSCVNAWKSYSLCIDCADLLFVYKFHTIKPDSLTSRRPFMASIAGEPALVVPYTNATASNRQVLVREAKRYAHFTAEDVEESEADLLDILREERSLLSLTFIWADFGQNIEKLRGAITDVPPSRLNKLSKFNDESTAWHHPLFPEISLSALTPDLSLHALKPLFWRPGGKKAQDSNSSKRLSQLRRQVAAAAYHSKPIPFERFWDEALTTARWYVMETTERGDAYGLLHEGVGKNGPYLTAAGWVRHFAWWLYYFRRLEVLPMSDVYYQPRLEELKPYFGAESGIDSEAKAFAFMLGILYGRLLQIQGARGVNVGANALTWLKRLTLTGNDLPELYVKTREKLLAYESERSKKVRSLLEEIGGLGVRLGNTIKLDDTTTCYYLLLGQSLSSHILAKKEEEETNE